MNGQSDRIGPRFSTYISPLSQFSGERILGSLFHAAGVGGSQTGSQREDATDRRACGLAIGVGLSVLYFRAG